jgi:SAM-dependent methyltransferase
MEVVRKPNQGVLNIIRFNWHFYLIAGIFSVGMFVASIVVAAPMSWIIASVAGGITLSTIISLYASWYVYDRSDLYNFHWLKDLGNVNPENVVNIHAGFDETSSILSAKFPSADLKVFDFYDPDKHTEISIERARKAYPPFPGTIKITTDGLPVQQGSVQLIFNIFALHEVRDSTERTRFLKAQADALAHNGLCIIVEHLRDAPNFLAYNIGFLHFHSRHEWMTNIGRAGLHIENKFKITPLITVLILKKVNGNTH